MSRLHTSIAQWGLVSGIRQEQSDLAVVVPPPSRMSPEARKGQLLLVVEAEGDVARGRNACTLVAETIREAFYSDPSISITSSLRAALKAANAALYQFNFEAPPHKRATVGCSCAVFHGHDLYLTQVPPTQAFVAHAGKLRGLPYPLSWSGGAQGGPAMGYSAALGTSLGSEPEFFRSVLQSGDTVVLSSSNVGRLLGKTQAEQLICFSDAATVAEGLYELCRRNHLPEAHALVVELMPELSAEARQSPLSVTGVSERSKLAADRVGDWVVGMTGAARRALQPDKRAAVAEHDEEEPHESARVAPPPVQPHESARVAPLPEPPFLPPPGPPPSVEPIQSTGDLLDRVPVGDAEPLPLTAFLGEGPYGGIVRPPAVKRDRRIDLGDNQGVPVDFAALPRKATPPPPGMVEGVTLPVRGAVVRALGGIANRPRRKPRPRALEGVPAPLRTKVRGLSYRRERPPLPWLNILLILGVLTLLVVVGLQQNRRRDLRTIDTALLKVETAVAAAESAPVEADAQQQLIDAEVALDDLAPLKASGLLTETKQVVWTRYEQVLARYDRARAAINRLGVFSDLETVVTVPVVGGQASRVVLGEDPETVGGLLENRFYVLDRGNEGGTLYELRDGTLQKTLGPGEDAGTVVTGKLRDLFWRLDNPVTLDRDDNPFNALATLYFRGENGWLANRLQGSELLPLGELIGTSFGGHLYLWDTEKQQLMRYSSGMFADLPMEWITDRGDAQLDQVVGVQIDGDVYLLRSDGSIVVFNGGVYQRTLPTPNLAPAVQTITRFYVTPDVRDEATGDLVRAGHIFLLDTLNERVIQIDKSNGDVILQMQARERGPLNRLMDLQVDGARNLIYLSNGDHILRARLPEPPAPVAPTNTTTTPEATPSAAP